MKKRRLFLGDLSLRLRIVIKLQDAWRRIRGTHVGRFGFCPMCLHWKTTIELRRQMTQYTDDASNWMTQCRECQDYADDYWAERWRDYYSDIY